MLPITDDIRLDAGPDVRTCITGTGHYEEWIVTADFTRTPTDSERSGRSLEPFLRALPTERCTNKYNSFHEQGILKYSEHYTSWGLIISSFAQLSSIATIDEGIAGPKNIFRSFARYVLEEITATDDEELKENLYSRVHYVHATVISTNKGLYSKICHEVAEEEAWEALGNSKVTQR
ncbi:hypothetical protein PUN28_019236 [Cardiocondyla obscurior]|uniref:Uncharacterized protein n=1 Tax=Cardiocondyla obscurior TaxID=286306 RepID=A0AAW2ECI1_9HYME